MVESRDLNVGRFLSLSETKKKKTKTKTTEISAAQKREGEAGFDFLDLRQDTTQIRFKYYQS